KSSGARTGSGTLADPWAMPPDVMWIGPMLVGNYANQTGWTFFDKIIIEDADAVGDAAGNATALNTLNTKVTTLEGTVSSQASALSSVTATANSANANITNLMEVTATSNAIGLVDGGFETSLGWGVSATLDSPNQTLPAKTVYRT